MTTNEDFLRLIDTMAQIIAQKNEDIAELV